MCFSNQCGDIVCGSDHGVVYVFNRRSGEVVDELRVDRTEWVQTVTVSIIFPTLNPWI